METYRQDAEPSQAKVKAYSVIPIGLTEC